MKTIYLTSFVFMLVLWAGCASSNEKIVDTQPASPTGQHPQMFEKTITKTVSCQYLLFLPESYGEKQQHWPLILFLHGAGERGDDLDRIKIYGPPQFVEKNKDFPFIVVSPLCPSGQWWSNDLLIALLDEITAKYAVDSDRVYLTGLSMGGFGTWRLACWYPDRFAAIAPVCGGYEPYLASRLKDVPVWAFHGARDELVPVRRSEEMVDAINLCGGNAKLTVYPNVDHGAWFPAYSNKQLYDWFLEHRKSNKTK